MTKIQLKRSSVLNNATTSRAPTSAQLDYGELAINYNTADPQFFIKDSSGSVIRVLDAYAKVDGTTFTGDVNFDGNVKIKGDSTNGAGKLTLSCETDTYSVNIKAPPTSAAASYTLTLPTSAGSSNQVLVTDGSGGLSWALSSMTTADKNKLDGIESGATADQTGAEIKTLYEAEADTNAFTDALLNKLNNIASGAQVNVATNLGKSTATTSVTITSSTGTDVTIGEATGSIAGLMTTAHHNKLDGIEAGATADQTAAEILTAIKTVDGSGSGLDADTLDGIQGSSYLRSDTSDTFSGGTLTVNGGSGLAIKAESADFAEQLEIHRNHSTQSPAIKFSNDTEQVGILFAAPTGYVLRWRDGSSTNSHKIWHSGNDGSGSGLDADTLDGNQASAFALKSGATFTGEIQCNARLDVGDGSDGNHEIRIYKADNDVSDHIQFYNGTTRVGEIGCKDTTWLRINQDTAKNIYTPRYIRADGGFFVDGTTKGINGSGNFVGGTIAGASDYSTLLRSNANDVIGGVLSYHSNDARLQFRNTSYNTYLYIGGWSNTNSNDISRIRNSSGNLHIDSAANGNLYLNHYSTGAIYARGQTVWHAGNDGSGSGLDADTLDGLNSTALVQNSSGLESNLDTFYAADMFGWATSTTGRPESYGQGIAIVSSGRTHNNSNNWITQLAFGTATNTSYFRTKVNAGGWSSWHKLWNSGNDGSGSGLDADTLDGIQGSSYLRSDTSDTFSGGTLTVNGGSGLAIKAESADFAEQLEIHRNHSTNSPAIKFTNNSGQQGILYADPTGNVLRWRDGTSSNNHQIWHAGNDGSGSGLDADTLDGLNSSNFARINTGNTQSFGINNSGAWTPGAGNTSEGISLRYTKVAYFSYNGVAAYFNRNSNGDLISYRRSGTEEGSIEINTSRVYYRTTSDYRRKTNVTPIENGIDVIKALKPSAYNWLEDNRLDHGFLAHEIQEHVPGSASGYKDEVDEEGEPVYQKVDLTTVVPFLTAALKDSIARIESLEAEVVALKSQLDS